MNNSFITMEEVLVETERDISPILRERQAQLADIIEALEHISSSSHWKVLQKYVFDVELDRAKRMLISSKDTTEIFRLQGEIDYIDKNNVVALLGRFRNELASIKQKLL